MHWNAAWLKWELYFKCVTFSSLWPRWMRILLSMTPISSNRFESEYSIYCIVLREYLSFLKLRDSMSIRLQEHLFYWTVMGNNSWKLTRNPILIVYVLPCDVSFVESENTPLLQLQDKTLAGDMMMELAVGHAGIICSSIMLMTEK